MKELKSGWLFGRGQGNESINRTMKELKFATKSTSNSDSGYQSHHEGIEIEFYISHPPSADFYQSHHEGIEITLSDGTVIVVNAINRTMKELKWGPGRRGVAYVELSIAP